MEVTIPAQTVSVTSGYQVIITNVVVGESPYGDNPNNFDWSTSVNSPVAPEGTLVLSGGFIGTYAAGNSYAVLNLGPSSDGTTWSLSGGYNWSPEGHDGEQVPPSSDQVLGYTYLIVMSLP